MQVIRRMSGAVMVAAALSIASHALPVHGKAPVRSGEGSAAALTGVNQRAELARQIIANVSRDAQRLKLPATWQQTLLVALLSQPVARLERLTGLHGYGAVMAELARPKGKALGEPDTDLVFKPFAPCRYLDTRWVAGKINGLRQYDLANDGSVYQGASGCNALTLAGVANDTQIAALAVNVTLIDTSSGAPGFVAIQPAGTANITSTANWATASASFQDANATVVAIDQTSAVNEFEIYTSGPVHVIVDLLGAFVAPEATALDCITNTNPGGATTTGDVSAGQSAIFQVNCSAGYTVTGGGCHYFTTTQQAPAVTDNKVIINRSVRPFDQSSQTFLNSWLCHWTNNDSITWRVQARAVCCRVPGR